MTASFSFRAAVVGDAGALSALALESKGHWPYSAEFLAACRDELTYTAAQIESENTRFVVAETRAGAAPDGFYLLTFGRSRHCELNALFIRPACIGQGLGRALFAHAVAVARAAAVSEIELHADPYAEAFYAAMGARTVGYVPSGSWPGRELPLMRFSLSGVADDRH
ncbi:MAG: GNAT family N-acetyltransferase [Pseudomonadota bacterium]